VRVIGQSCVSWIAGDEAKRILEPGKSLEAKAKTRATYWQEDE
jgi:hypothetical protein